MADLRKLRTGFEALEDPAYSSILALADVCVDSATAEPEDAHGHVLHADMLLNETIIDIKEGAQRYPSLLYEDTPHLIAAYLRRAELANWLRAAQGETPAEEYETLLAAGSDIVGLTHYHPKGLTKAVEFMPVLLGARGLARGSGGWVGRLALAREDHRGRTAEGRNPNWDVALCHAATAPSFVTPNVRINTKMSSKICTGLYAAAGVRLLAARDYDIGSPQQIIWSCINEVGNPMPAIATNTKPFSSDRLDEITGRIAQDFLTPAMAPRVQAA
jgi:hypothetical protein